ncbi:GSU2403 family nucleotidyltransferase fold protein [soil metagenome]
MKLAPLAIQTLYADLLQQVHAVAERPGSVYARTIKGHRYLSVKRSAGSFRRDDSLGRADDPAVIEKAAAIRAESARAKDRRKIVRALVSGGVAAPGRKLGSLLDVMADAGLFRDGVLVGTGAYQCYAPYIGATLASATAMTEDADLATATLALAAANASDTMETILKRADQTFRPVPGLSHKAPPASFRSANGFLVDLLTPQYRRSDMNPMPLPALAAGAVPMQHLAWLIETPVSLAALYGPGVPVRVPEPSRYAIHKLILAQRRIGHAVKRRKDLQQAAELIAILTATSPWELSDAYEDACAQGKAGWRELIHRSLKEIGVSPKTLVAT